MGVQKMKSGAHFEIKKRDGVSAKTLKSWRHKYKKVSFSLEGVVVFGSKQLFEFYGQKTLSNLTIQYYLFISRFSVATLTKI